jgi:hypothetical protein
MPAGAEADNPCAAPEPQTLTLELGVLQSTAWKLDVMYAVDDDRKLGPGFIFLLHQGERRWETRRDAHNWSVPMLWRGFCWRGLEYPKARAKQVQVQVAPLCKDGKLLESGKCSAVFKER